jgi:hypothetical protein
MSLLVTYTNCRIPAAVGGLGLLTHLRLAHNRLTGTLPDISACAFLVTLDLSHNRLSGPLGTHFTCFTGTDVPILT